MGGLIQSVAGLKNKDQDFLKKKTFSSKLQHWLFPEFSVCWPALSISDLPVTLIVQVKWLKSLKSLSPLCYIMLCYILCFSSKSEWIHWGNYYSIHLLHCWGVLSFNHWVPGLRTGSGPKLGKGFWLCIGKTALAFQPSILNFFPFRKLSHTLVGWLFVSPLRTSCFMNQLLSSLHSSSSTVFSLLPHCNHCTHLASDGDNEISHISESYHSFF